MSLTMHMLEIVLRAAILLTLVLLLSLAFKQISVRASKASILAGFVCVLLLPVAQFLPKISVAVLPAESIALEDRAATSVPTLPIAADAGTSAVRMVPGGLAGSLPFTGFLLIGLWLTGTAVVAGLSIRGWVSFHRGMAATLKPAPPQLEELVKREVEALELKSIPAVKLSPSIPAPAVAGLVKPAIILPEQLSSASRGRLQIVFRHELQHIKGHDLRWRALALVAASCFWFLPLIWLLLRKLLTAQEAAVDAALLEAGIDRYDYAELLLKLGAGQPQSPAAAMASNSSRRLKQILNFTSEHRGASAALVLVSAILLLGTVFGEPVSPASSQLQGDDWIVQQAEEIQSASPGQQQLRINQLRASDDRRISRLFATLLPRLESDNRLLLLYEIRDRADPAVMDAVIQHLSLLTPSERHLVVRYLRAVGTTAARDSLIALLADPDQSVRMLVWHGLGELADSRQKGVLERAMRNEKDSNVRSLAMRVLTDLPDHTQTQ